MVSKIFICITWINQEDFKYHTINQKNEVVDMFFYVDYQDHKFKKGRLHYGQNKKYLLRDRCTLHGKRETETKPH